MSLCVCVCHFRPSRRRNHRPRRRPRHGHRRPAGSPDHWFRRTVKAEEFFRWRAKWVWLCLAWAPSLPHTLSHPGTEHKFTDSIFVLKMQMSHQFHGSFFSALGIFSRIVGRVRCRFQTPHRTRPIVCKVCTKSQTPLFLSKTLPWAREIFLGTSDF